MTRSIFITRHGQRIDHVNKDWKSVPGNPGTLHLSPYGIEQAKALGQRLRGEGVRRIYASPFYRTIETAQYIAEIIDAPICVEYGVCEFLQPRHFPNGLVPRTAEQMAPIFDRVDRNYQTLLHPQGTEDRQAIERRTAEAMAALVEADHEPFLIVSHGMSTRLLTCALLGELREDLRTGHECALTQVSWQAGRWQLVHEGETSHLPDPGARQAGDEAASVHA